MKTPSVHAAIVACALFAPLVSAQDPSPPAKPAMGMQMDKQMSQMRVNMKMMQHGQMMQDHQMQSPIPNK
jgi:hypothetical protein